MENIIPKEHMWILEISKEKLKEKKKKDRTSQKVPKRKKMGGRDRKLKSIERA